MTTRPALVDTDILSAIMRKRQPAVEAGRVYLSAYKHFSFSIITRYEVLRGLSAKRATVQIAAFNSLCIACEIVPLTEPVVLRAAEIYADLYRRGELIGDADILIAATALHLDRSLITNNTSHFARIRDLQVENWLAP